MRLRFPLTIVFLLLCFHLAGCSGDRGRQLPQLSADAVILAFGDSLTYGTGAGRDESYPARLQKLIGREVINAGVPGETTDEGLQRLPSTVTRHQPDLILLCLGGNDFLQRVDPAVTRSNLDKMIAWVKDRNIPLVLIAVPEMKLLGGVNPLYEELAEKHGVVLEDDILLEVLRERSFKSDPIHPNAQGYRRIATAVAELLRERGAIQ